MRGASFGLNKYSGTALVGPARRQQSNASVVTRAAHEHVELHADTAWSVTKTGARRVGPPHKERLYGVQSTSARASPRSLRLPLLPYTAHACGGGENRAPSTRILRTVTSLAAGRYLLLELEWRDGKPSERIGARDSVSSERRSPASPRAAPLCSPGRFARLCRRGASPGWALLSQARRPSSRSSETRSP